MSLKLIAVQLRVGTTADAPPLLKDKLTTGQIRKYVGLLFNDYTVIPAKGAYKKEREDSAIVELFFPISDRTEAHEVYEWCTRVHRLIENLLRKLAQRAVIGFVTVSTLDREIRWSVVSKLGDGLENPPIPWIALLVRYVLGSDKLDTLGLPGLYNLVQKHFKGLGVSGSQGAVFNDLPAVGFRAPVIDPLVFRGRGFDVKHEAERRRWDAAILVSKVSTDADGECPSGACEETGKFLSRFQVVTRDPAYYVTNLSGIRTQEGFQPVQVRVCPL